jgi:hypothetical protein
MLDLFTVRMGYEREWYERPNYWPVLLGWCIFLCSIIAGVVVDFINVWAGFVMSTPVFGVLVWVWRLQNRG